MHPYFDYQHLIFSIFDAPAETVASHYYRRDRQLTKREQGIIHRVSPIAPELLNPDRYHLEQREFDLAWAYRVRPTPGWQPFQELFWEPVGHPRQTVMMNNTPYGEVSGRGIPWQCIHVAIRDKDPVSDPSYVFYYYQDNERIQRVLGAARDDDGPWVFTNYGPVQPFETPDYYKRRRIRDRCNREIITEYLQRLGYDITDPAFWTTSTQAWLLWDDFGGKKPAPTRHVYRPESEKERAAEAPPALPLWGR